MKFFLIVLSLLGGSFFMILSTSNQEILIESLESKNINGEEVYNKISFYSKDNQDIWEMKQSHQGVNLHEGQWDELKIVVDKTTTPNSVSYHQLENGKESEYKVSCFLCHANGPRAIRANFKTKNVKTPFSDRLKIYLWNFRIKSYGRVVLKQDSLKRKVSVQFSKPHLNQKLNVPTCLKCHHENDDFFSRGPLLRQHFMSIKYLVDNKQMPPWPFSLSKKEKKEIEKFLKNF
jgi:hypothetical protein